MTKLIDALRAEMRAAAKGESKGALASLRSELQAIRKSLALLERHVASGRWGGAAAGSRRSRGPTASAPAGAPGDGRRARFAPGLMRKHREALGMSRKTYAGLLGVSGLSVYLWEAGRNKPRRDTVLAWQDLRKKGARELRAMAGSAPAGRKGRAAGTKRASSKRASSKRGRRTGRGRRSKAA